MCSLMGFCYFHHIYDDRIQAHRNDHIDNVQDDDNQQ